MTKEKKNEFTLKISQANKTELIIILYDIAITYIEEASEAINSGNIDEAKSCGSKALSCIEEMQNNLHFEYDLAKKLKQLYLFMKKQLRAGMVSGDFSGYELVKKELKSLKDAYEQIKNTDKSGPVMVHTQSVISGMTYGKDKLLDSLTTECSSRGYRV